MRVLIVDDSNVKIADIVSTLREISEVFEVEICNDCIETLKVLSKKKFDLIVLDMLLPLRYGDEPEDGNGKYIVKEIHRNDKVKPPTYVLCLTQFDKLVEDFHPIWRTLKYDRSSTGWKIALRELLVYISRQHSRDDRIIIDKTPTIFVEGETDVKIIDEAIRIYFPEIVGKIKTKSQTSAGADWVVRQLIIWASSLPKDDDGRPIKAVGIFDNDQKGSEAIEELHRIIGNSSAEAKFVRALRYTTKHALHLIPIYIKGIKLPISLEEMFEYKYWRQASDNKWLEDRRDIDLILQDPKNWNKRTMGLDEHIASLGFSEEEIVYLGKISNKAKNDFVDLILKLDDNEKKEALKCFKILLDDAVQYILS